MMPDGTTLPGMATRERPILFSGPMVRALLAGRKLQTRRVIKDAPDGEWFADRDGPGDWRWVAPEGRPTMPIRLPYAPGDRLWVREAFATYEAIRSPNPLDNIVYRADLPATEPPITDPITSARLLWTTAPKKWRSPIHMPRWASRLILLVTDVRVRRVTDISGADAQAEGIVAFPRNPSDPCWGVSREGPMAETPRDAFRDLWDSLNGHRPGASWDENPWVVAYTFSVENRDA